MNARPYTPKLMDAARESSELRSGRFDGLHAEAKAALGYAGNTLSGVRERYREAYRDELAQWQSLRDELDAADMARQPALRTGGDGNGGNGADPALAAERAASGLRLGEIRAGAESLGRDLNQHETFLHRLDLTQHAVENVWLFLEQDDETLIAHDVASSLPTAAALRVVEAQEAERARLAQEIHDGPAQALSNAIFQVEYIERMLDHDPALARTELHYLRQVLRRELGDVRTFISQLRPRILDQLGLDGSIRETVDNMAALTGLPITVNLAAPAGRLSETEQTVVLRLVQEALQNVRKHAGATSVGVTSRVDGDTWLLEVRDDGRGFDVGAVAARGRRNFGLQFMRERAELIGAGFEVRSRPGGGTVVVLAIPLREEHT